MLSWKMQFWPHISLPSSFDLKNSKTKGVIFWEECFEYLHPYVIFENAVLPTTSSRSSQFEKFQRQNWVIFFQMKHFEKTCFEYPHSMLSLKMQFSPHISSPSRWIWKFLTRMVFLKTLGSPWLWTTNNWTLDSRPPWDNSYEYGVPLLRSQ